jgi:hypothetical protein
VQINAHSDSVRISGKQTRCPFASQSLSQRPPYQDGVHTVWRLYRGVCSRYPQNLQAGCFSQWLHRSPVILQTTRSQCLHGLCCLAGLQTLSANLVHWCAGMFWRSRPDMGASVSSPDWPRNGAVLQGWLSQQHDGWVGGTTCAETAHMDLHPARWKEVSV